jgi:excinuclease ABC subunit A
VPCEVCHGARYNRETLEVHFKGKTVADVLDMPIEEAAEFFAAFPAIARYLTTLVEVGLGYVRLGQPAPTLSGGEAQRVKLASELQKRSTGRTAYVLDEPTTGLHFEDVRKLLGVLQSLADKGNSVLVIEHNLDVIKSADWIVDMGPEGGSGGGTVVAEGTPEHVATVAASHTGRYLAEVLDGAVPVAAPVAVAAPVKPAVRRRSTAKARATKHDAA